MAVAFNTGNLKPVAEAIRKKYPRTELVLAADNDHATEGNPGITKGKEAAKAVGALLAAPDLSGDEGTDFNDLAVIHGLEAVREALGTATAAHEPQKGRFILANHFEGYNREINYLIKGWLPAEAFGVVYGPSGCGKSFFVLCLAIHIALGREWNGCKVEQAPVLYVAGEGGVGVPQRIKALADEHNGGEGMPDLYRLDHPVLMDGDESELASLLGAINEKCSEVDRDFGLVILDTVARCMAGDENSNTDMNGFIRACCEVTASTGATVLLVHHTGKGDQETARGASALRAACDYEYLVKKADTPDLGLAVQCKKMKDGKDDHAAQFSLTKRHLFNDRDGDPVTTLVCSDTGGPIMSSSISRNDKAPLSPRQQTIYQIVRSRMQAGGSTTRELVRGDLKAQGADIKNFSRDVRSLVAKGLLEERDGSLYTLLTDQDAVEEP